MAEKGIREYLKLRSQEKAQVPSYWANFTGPISLSIGSGILDRHKRVSVDSKTKKAIIDLVMGTWKTDLVGQGADAVYLSHSTIRIKKIERLEWPQLYVKYFQKRAEICLKGYSITM